METQTFPAIIEHLTFDNTGEELTEFHITTPGLDGEFWLDGHRGTDGESVVIEIRAITVEDEG